MLRNMTERLCRLGMLTLAAAFALIVTGMCMNVQAQTMRRVSGQTQVGEPLFREYMGVTIGMRADEVRAKLGTPRETSAIEDFYARSDNGFVQVLYDDKQRVHTLSVTYVGEVSGTPSLKEVFVGEVAAAADGSVNKLVRYPRAGIWVAYNRTAGTDPIITVTIQKLKE